jgi:predicted DNA-binding helix-hairpin-helix protein
MGPCPPGLRAWSYKANAEILLMEPCLYGCYYCIGNQMPASVRSDLRAPFR